MNKGMLMYLMTGNPIFMLMGSGGSSNTMLMLYMMGAFGNAGTGATQLSTATGTMNPLILALAMSGNRRRSYRRRSRAQTVYVRRR